MLQRPNGVEWRHVNWNVVVGIGLMHVLAVLAPFYFSWSAVIIAVVLMWLSGGIGITTCFHRLLTHRSFRTYRWFEYLLTTLGCLSLQGSPIDWVGTHRIHHKHSDKENDPHSPRHGFTWSHMLWMVFKRPDGFDPKDFAKDLLRHRGHRVISRLFWLPQFLLAAMLVLGAWPIGGAELALSWVAWGIGLRTVMVYHGTWFVNSAAHTWGYQSYDTKDGSRNLWWVALIGFGEGWHNNHHYADRSAAHGLRWWEFDITYRTIQLFALLGLAWDIWQIPPEKIAR